MKRLFGVALLVSLTVPAVARAQEPGSGPVAGALKAALQRATRAMPGAADLMPAEKFGFKPTPEQMSFGEILAHGWPCLRSHRACQKVARYAGQRPAPLRHSRVVSRHRKVFVPDAIQREALLRRGGTVTIIES